MRPKNKIPMSKQAALQKMADFYNKVESLQDNFEEILAHTFGLGGCISDTQYFTDLMYDEEIEAVKKGFSDLLEKLYKQGQEEKKLLSYDLSSNTELRK